MSPFAEGRRTPRLLALWFGFSEPVTRGTYARHGFALMLAKYAIDATVVGLATHRFWTPLAYLSPSLVLRDRAVALPAWLQFALALWTLPFLWIGVSMTMRRMVDAGRSAWMGLLFFLPVVNYFVMLGLCFTPSAPDRGWTRIAEASRVDDRLQSALIAVAVCVALALPLVAVQTLLLRGYGLTLFFGQPFVLGAVAGWIFNRRHPRALGDTLLVVFVSHGLALGALLLFAVEGAICLAMAFPLVLGVGLMGGVFGRAIARHAAGSPAPALLALLALPLLGAVEARAPIPPEVGVTTSRIVDAPPDVVWRHVVSFGEIPPAREWLFHLGVACPVRATIVGKGVGAVRRCEFTTGAFVEPITVWDAPSRLAFDVREEPIPMEEWSPYAHVYATHLQHYFRSRRGEFRLTALPGNRTRLDGSTWYTLDVHPNAYWRLWADGFVHTIHTRVLDHVAHLAEEDGRRVAQRTPVRDAAASPTPGAERGGRTP